MEQFLKFLLLVVLYYPGWHLILETDGCLTKTIGGLTLVVVALLSPLILR